jgi:hypothetical protein
MSIIGDFGLALFLVLFAAGAVQFMIFQTEED